MFYLLKFLENTPYNILDELKFNNKSKYYTGLNKT